MTPIELMALILIIVAAIKMIVILTKPKIWADLVKKVWTNSLLVMLVSLVLAAIALSYIAQELTILQIFAVMLFAALLAAISMASYSKEIIALAEKMLRGRKILKKAWLSIAIWIILIIWALIELFA